MSHAGLVPAMRLAELVGLERLAARHVRVNAEVGANAGLKIGSLIAGMVAGADDIEGMDLLRHGAIPATFGGIRAPSTLGSFLRAFDHGNVRQLAAVGRRVLAELASRTPLLPGGQQLAFIDVDSTQKRVYGPAKQGAAFGHTKIASKSLTVRGLNALAAAVSTPLAAPVVTTARLRGGNAASARGAASLVAESITTSRDAGISGLIVARGDSAFYTGAFVSACRRNNAHFSVTARMDPKIRRAITGIDETAWTPIKYPNAIFDEQAQQWISDAEIAEVGYTAFASSKTHRVDARLIVRRVKRLNRKAAAQGQDELFATYRYHAVFTDSPFGLVEAESQHRGHAIVEQVFADLFDGPLAHLPSGRFHANAAWLQLAVTAHALTRALGVLASPRHAVARGATIRNELISVACRPARSGRDQITWHLPESWPWEYAWLNTFDATHRGPPATAA
ncbi:MAG: IS1380 family transposase [Tomitella sp.]|nr:IS1380 family transposase [Tomitella sp.]